MKHKGLSLISVATLVVVTSIAFSDDHANTSSRGRAAPPNPQYTQDCGTCHLAYPPGLLPARSWNHLIDTLDNHFGENAELPPADRERLRAFLTQNAADQVSDKRSRRVMASLRGATPARITDIPYIVAKHREIPRGAIGPNAQVKSLSDCAACHGPGAAQGVFHEHDVVIPGFGPWKD
jgi:hypothetical protein